MTTQTGNDGVLSFGGSDVTELKAWSYATSAQPIPDTAMGDAEGTSKAGIPSTTGSLEVHYDEADAVQEAMDAGAEGVLILFPKGNSTGNPRLTATVQITERGGSGGIDEILPQTFSWAVSQGSLVRDLVP